MIDDRLCNEVELRKVLGSRIAKHRRLMGMTQAELGKIVGLHQPTICKIEQGRLLPSRQRIDQICEALGISRYDLERRNPDSS